MKTRTAVLVVLALIFLALIVLPSALAVDIPGGIVYSNGKDAIYHDFENKGNKSLTSGYSQTIVKHPFAVSDNGKTLIWMQESKFWVLDFPLGTPKAVPVNKAVKEKIGNNYHSSALTDIVEPMLWQNGDNIKNMAVSPDGKHFTFDSDTSDVGWVCLDPGDPKAFARLWAAGTYNNFQKSIIEIGDMRFNVLPFWGKRNDLFHGIFCLGTKYNRLSFPADNPFAPVFGNVIEWPRVPLFRTTTQDSSLPVEVREIKQPPTGNSNLIWLQGKPDNDVRVYNQPNIKKNACFLTHQKTGGKSAFIYQIGPQWGPIEIKTFNDGKDYESLNTMSPYDEMQISFNKKNAENENLQARELEIQTSFPSVEGLAWMPDGSLTVFSQGNVFMIKNADIESGFARSRVEIIAEDNKNWLHTKQTNNILLRPKLELIAEGIVGSCFNWVDDSSLLFLAPNNNVYLRTREKMEKIADAIGPFCYCSGSPFDRANTTIATVPTNRNSFVSGKGTVGKNNSFSVGSIKFHWKTGWSGVIDITSDPYNLSRGFALAEETDFEKINPAQYEYKTQYKFANEKASNVWVQLFLNEIIIFQFGTDYVGIKLVKMNQSPIAGTTESGEKREILQTSSIDYESAYWSAVPNFVGEKIKHKSWENTLADAGWKFTQKKFGEEFEIAWLKITWRLPDAGYSPTKGVRPEDFSLLWKVEEGQPVATAYASGLFKNLVGCPQFREIGEIAHPRGLFHWPKEKDLKRLATLLFKVGDTVIAVAPMKKEAGGMEFRFNQWETSGMIALKKEQPKQIVSLQQTALSPLEPKEWQISVAPVEQKFKIGNFELYWGDRKETGKDGSVVYDLNFEIPQKSIMEMVIDNEKEDIECPEKNTFSRFHRTGHLSRAWFCNRIVPENVNPFIFRLGGGEYLLIVPKEKRLNPEGIEWIQFKWQHLPATQSELLESNAVVDE